MRRILVSVLFVVLVTPVTAQIARDRTKAGRSTWGGTSRNLFFGSGNFRNHFGFLPILPVSRERATALFLTGFLFSGHRPTAAGTGRDFLFGGDPYHSPFYSYSPYGFPFGGYGSPYYQDFFGYQGLGPRPALYNSALFVEEWKDRDPAAGRGESHDSNLQQSILLSEGMDEEQVVRAVGSPMQRVQLGERTVWKYAGYALLFDGGKLKEIR